jgi:hypothetical protein
MDGATGHILWDYLAAADLVDGVAIAPNGSVLIIVSASDTAWLIALKGTSPLASTPWPKKRGNSANTGVGWQTHPPTILAQPVDYTTPAGGSVFLSVDATGAGPLTYQWLLEGLPIQAATNSSFTLGAAEASSAGKYSVRVGNAYGSVTSATARVTVIPIPRTWVTTIAGDGHRGDVDDPDARFGELRSPGAPAVNPRDGTLLTPSGNSIRAIHRDGRLETYAGQPTAGRADGDPLNARFSSPSAVALDHDGNLIVADTANHQIRMIARGTRVTTTLAGTGVAGRRDSTALESQFDSPIRAAVDSRGAIYVTERSGLRDGTNQAVRFSGPAGIALDVDGSLLIADSGNHQVRRLSFAPPELRPSFSGNLAIQLRPWLMLHGEPGQQFRIDSSEAPFGPWATLTNITLATSNAGWFDPTSWPERRYYRSVPKP